MLFAVLAFGLMAVCVKVTSEQGIPALEIIAARALLSSILCYIDVSRRKINIWGTHKLLLIARGLTGTCALFFFYSALSILPIAEATLLQYLNPIFTAILALIFLKESLKKSTLFSILLALIGLVITVYPNLYSDFSADRLGVLYGLGGAVFASIAYVIIRRLAQIEDTSVIIFYFPIIALPISLLGLNNDFVMPNFETFIFLIFVGVFTQIGQYYLTKAMKIEKAAKVTAYSYMQVAFSAFLGIYFFNETLNIYTLLGSIIIFIAILINALSKR